MFWHLQQELYAAAVASPCQNKVSECKERVKEWIYIGHAWEPAVVLADGDEDTTTVVVDKASEEFSGPADVEILWSENVKKRAWWK